MSRLKSDVQITLLSRIPVMLLSFLSVVFLTRLLGPEGNGVYTFTFAALNLFFTVIGFQLEGTLPVFLARDKKHTPAIFSAIGLLALLSFVVFAMTLTIVVFFLPGGQQWVIPPDQPVMFFFLFLLIAFGLRRISTLILAALRGLFWFKMYNALMLLNHGLPAIVYGTLLVLTTSGAHELSLLQCFKIILLIEIVLAMSGVFFLWQKKMISFSTGYADYLKPISSLSFKSLLSSSGHFLNKRLDVWFVQFYKGTAMLGQYGLATQVTNFISDAMTPFNQVLIPYIAEAPPEQHRGIVARTARLNISIAVSAAAGIICTSWLFIPILFGKAFAEAIPATQILAIGIIFISQRLVFTGYFKAINQMQYPMKASWAGVIMTIGLDFLLIPTYGIIGAAWATAIAYATTSVYLVYMAQKKLGFGLTQILLIKKSDITWLLSRKSKNEDIHP